MRVHNGFADGQAESGAAAGASAGFVSPVKALEDLRQILGGDAHAGVGDGEDGSTIFRAGAEADFAVGLIVVDRVSEQVGEDLCQVVGVAEGFGERQVTVDLKAALAGERTDAFDTGAGGFRQVEALAPAVFLAGFEAREFEQRFGEPSHLLSGVQAGFDGLAVFGGAAFARQGGLRFGDDHRQRRAELVGSVRGELLLLGEGGFEPGEGGIQDSNQPAQFVAWIDRANPF